MLGVYFQGLDLHISVIIITTIIIVPNVSIYRPMDVTSSTLYIICIFYDVCCIFVAHKVFFLYSSAVIVSTVDY